MLLILDRKNKAFRYTAEFSPKQWHRGGLRLSQITAIFQEKKRANKRRGMDVRQTTERSVSNSMFKGCTKAKNVFIGNT